jgi:hypothetical protein
MQNIQSSLQNTDFKDKKTLEKYSSMFTLSDMELFIFPELFYPLVIANIMSPVIWEWKKDKWFKDINKKSFNYKVNRIKQFIMDNYVFNLDLETWGLTTKDREINRFKDFFDIELLRKSNALFGYEGDKYYFDIDIRKHFGLEKYTDDTIPYWKTETIEAMTAFQHKEGFTTGAGECVSLSALYAAAMFVIGEIPLDKIYLIATPLHSQNFLTVNDGVLTNNRRIVTKNMWFNGTVLSAKARRALENENVTIVSHISGYIHTVYQKATIDELHYENFKTNLFNYLKTELTFEIFINFLRQDLEFQKLFQYEHVIDKKSYYIPLEKIFELENSSKNSFSEITRDNLLKEIDFKEFTHIEYSNLIIVNCIECFLKEYKNMNFNSLKDYFLSHYSEFSCGNFQQDNFINIKNLFENLEKFINLTPRLPLNNDKKFIQNPILQIETSMSREEILEAVLKNSEFNEVAKLSLYTFRQMDKINWKPFIKAAIERNPVSLINFKNLSVTDIYHQIYNMPNRSIYDSERLAQPDEVSNFRVGDGIEKAILFANILKNNFNFKNLDLHFENKKVILQNENVKYYFDTIKNFNIKDKVEIIK